MDVKRKDKLGRSVRQSTSKICALVNREVKRSHHSNAYAV